MWLFWAECTAMPRKSALALLLLLLASAASGEFGPNTLLMSEVMFSNSRFATEKAPTSHPARVKGAHGAGCTLPRWSTITGIGVGVVSRGSVKYSKVLGKDTVPSGLKNGRLFPMGAPILSRYTPLSVVRISTDVWEMSGVWWSVRTEPLSSRKLRRFGICSRSEGTLEMSRRKWTLSNWIYTTRWIRPLLEWSTQLPTLPPPLWPVPWSPRLSWPWL